MYPVYQHNVLPEQYDALLHSKATELAAKLAPYQAPELEVFASAPQGFRLRAEFRLWHDGDRCFYAMYAPGDKTQPYEVKQFPIASPLIQQLMQQLLTAIQPSEILRQRLFQVEFLTTLSGDALITLVYHKPLSDDWQQAAEQLQQQLGVAIIGRARKQKRVLSRDYVTETLQVDGQSFHYRQIEGGFTQPNGEMNQQMLSWARRCADGIGGDLLELYCGNGNFSIALADRFRKVLATEISKTSVQAAQVNIADNGIENLDIIRLSSEEFVQALRQQRSFRRLQDIHLQDYDFRTVLVDPPRAGLDDESVRQIQAYDNIIYISCNPDTLAANLDILQHSHRIERAALFDQFPYTHHTEAGVFLTRR